MRPRPSAPRTRRRWTRRKSSRIGTFARSVKPPKLSKRRRLRATAWSPNGNWNRVDRRRTVSSMMRKGTTLTFLGRVSRSTWNLKAEANGGGVFFPPFFWGKRTRRTFRSKWKGSRVSAWTNKRTSPRATVAPAATAGPRPPVDAAKVTRTFLRSLKAAFAASMVPSRPPASTTTTSRASQAASSRRRSVRPIVPTSLYAGITTDIMAISPPPPVSSSSSPGRRRRRRPQEACRRRRKA
mmetsp:Transcript_22720/g.73067  ORF Transcript_22720/g.73067 Transcript_22720/m.73067 type:complete len:239 (+) Transcript_22720:246-962(+)